MWRIDRFTIIRMRRKQENWSLVNFWMGNVNFSVRSQSELREWGKELQGKQLKYVTQFNQRHKNFQICLIMCTDFFLMKWALHRKKRKWHPSSEYVVLQDVVSECFLENNKILLTFVKICGSYNLHLSCQSPWGWTLWIWMLNMGSLQFAKTHGGAGVWVRVCNDKWRTFCKLTENNGALHCTPW